jgi:hypothetical protein
MLRSFRVISMELVVGIKVVRVSTFWVEHDTRGNQSSAAMTAGRKFLDDSMIHLIY